MFYLKSSHPNLLAGSGNMFLSRLAIWLFLNLTKDKLAKERNAFFATNEISAE